MVSEKIYKMSDYCLRVKTLIEEYEEVGLAQHDNPREELYTLINSAPEESMFLSVSELIGNATRAFNASGGAYTFPSWIGGENESFTKEYFVETMRKVWPQLFT